MNLQTEYYIRLLLFLVQCGMLVCRGVTYRELAGIGLDVILQPHEAKLRKKLLKSQYLMLFPKSGKPDVEDFDLSLLTVVLLDIFTLSTTEIQCVRVIKETRNNLSHNVSTALEEEDYNTNKTDLEDAFVELSSGLDVKLQEECSQLIRKFTKDPLDESDVLKYVKELRTYDELIQDIKEKIERKSEDVVQEIKAAERRITGKMSDMEKRLSTEFQKRQSDQTYQQLASNHSCCHHKPETGPVRLNPIYKLDITNKTSKGSTPLYTGLDYLSDGRLVVVDIENRELLVFNEKLENLASFDGFLDRPLCVVGISEEKVAVSFGQSISILRVSKSNEITILKTFNVKSNCSSMSKMDDGHLVTGTFDAAKPACIVSITGEDTDFNLTFQNKEYTSKLDATFCTYIRSGNKLVITDKYNHSVIIYDIATKTDVSVKDDQIKKPTGVAIGPFGYIFVCNRETHSIVQISPDGRVVASHKINIINPYRICFSQDKRGLAISNNYVDNNTLQVFEVNVENK